MGAWIETLSGCRQRSLVRVAPYMGAWIETHPPLLSVQGLLVAPYMGAWIETPILSHLGMASRSLPTWGRGLKQQGQRNRSRPNLVAPYMGAWIETVFEYQMGKQPLGRSLHGGVD